MKRDSSTACATLLMWSHNRRNLVVGLDDHNVWHGVWRAECKTANAPWDCAKSVLFYCFADDGMFDRGSEFPVKILTSVRSLMVSIFKWKGRWHWQFSPAVMKMYPTAAQTLCCFIISWLSWNVQLLQGTFCVFLFENNVSFALSMAEQWYPYTVHYCWWVWKKQRGEVTKRW